MPLGRRVPENRHQIVAPGIIEITVLQKANQTQPLKKKKQLYFENEGFLSRVKKIRCLSSRTAPIFLPDRDFFLFFILRPAGGDP